MTPILVTGSAGFIGKHLVRKLNEKKIKIFELEYEYLNDSNWEFSLISLLDKIKPKAIFHVGACTNTLENNVQLMMRDNYQSTKILMEWSRTNSIPFVYSSSAAIYGTNSSYPANLYGWSKYVAEDFVLKNGGLALRYFNVYGPGEDHKGTMASFIFQAHTKKLQNLEINLFPKNPKRDFVFIDDVISANIYGYENYENLRGKYYDVCSGDSHSFESMLEMLDVSFGYLDEEVIPIGYQFYTKGDKSRWMPGWFPKYSLESGIKEYKKYLQKVQTKGLN
jgi:ADP-L-glycero-D-manno-heptose 6-epimerase